MRKQSPQFTTAMGSSYHQYNYHFVFSTKYREPLISDTRRDRLHSYIGGVIRALDGYPRGVGGVENHVHILVGLRATHRVCDAVREIKKQSSIWVHHEIGIKSFRWQEGYAGFTVSGSMIPRVREYIARQEEHHRAQPVEGELRKLYEMMGITFDNRFLD